ncbi:MAG: hypothetical protein A2Z96_06110 [Spirochaetes bacterium GWB1_48_6]|nr:MAG: hypothetical protein A2Z96_06110 [Spirochaetes bacterium GWB1_48_6]
MDPKTKNSLIKRLVVVTLALVLYTFLFPRNLGSDLFFKPIKLTQTSSQLGGAFPDRGVYFKLAEKFGILDPEGTLVSSQEVPKNLAYSDENYSFYDESTGTLKILEKGENQGSLVSQPYSYWIGDRLFVFDENRMGLSEYQPDGVLRWKKDYPSLITAIDAGLNLSIVGLSDGRVEAYDKAGRSRMNYSPGGSRIPVIFNLALAPSEEYIALISGLDPKRFILLQKSRDEYRPVFHQPMSDVTRWATALGFLGDGEWAYYAQKDALHLVDTNSFKEIQIPVKGIVEKVALDSPSGLLHLVIREDNRTYIDIISLDGLRVAALSVPGNDIWFRERENRFFLGFEDKILVFQKVIK